MSQRQFRDYSKAPEPLKAFYRENHEKQTLQFVLDQKKRFDPQQNPTVLEGAWGMLEWLDDVRDESDPDTQLSQMQHALQAAEAARQDVSAPDWFVLTALIHDLGKALVLFGEPQWAVVGDTFPVGCPFSEHNIFWEYFRGNPDLKNPEYQKEFGIYDRHCGLDAMHFSWGHDEYLYRVVESSSLPAEARAIIRYHSAYPIHHEGAYRRFLSQHDQAMLVWIRRFQPYDLYSKDKPLVDVRQVRPYYQDLIAKYLPVRLGW